MEPVEYIQKNKNYGILFKQLFKICGGAYTTKKKMERKKKNHPKSTNQANKKPELKHNCGVTEALAVCSFQDPGVGVGDS